MEYNLYFNMKYAVATTDKKDQEIPYRICAIFDNLDDAYKYIEEKNSPGYYKIWKIFNTNNNILIDLRTEKG